MTILPDTLTTQTLEQVLNEGLASTEQGEVSEEIKEPEDETDDEIKSITFTPEQEEEIEKRFQSRRDKDLNPYREKHEANIALIRSLSSQIKELKSSNQLKKGNSLVEAILAGDDEAGFTPDETKSREQALKEFNNLYKDYKGKSAEVEEAFGVITSMAEKLPANIVKEFGLNDPNPNVRAVNGVKFLEDTAAVYKYTQNFQMVIEDFLPKGDELRKQIEEIVEGLEEFNDEKSKRLYLKDKKQGVKVTPRKKPPVPSDTVGGSNLNSLSHKELGNLAYTKKK